MSNITDSKNVMQAKDMQLVSTGQKIGKVLSKTGTYAFLLIMALIVLFPFYSPEPLLRQTWAVCL